MAQVKFEDLSNKLDQPESTIHICRYCKSTSFQLFEVKPPKSTRVRLKLVANCVKCGQWFNLDKYSFK